MIKSFTSQDLKPVLIKGAKAQLKNPYYLIEDEDQAIFVVSPGRNGTEFNKTVGYFSNFPSMQTYQCLYGSGILLIQRNDFSKKNSPTVYSGEVKEFKVVTLNPGRQVLVPAGWGMCLVNTGNNFLVVLRSSLLDEKYQDAKPILEKQGLAYYVVEKKGEISFQENPNYSFHPQITTE